MKQVIPFSKDIVFKTNIASITSISLEHEEKISDGEISGDFVIFGDYKIHNDTTEKELFKFKLPFTALIPDNVIPNTISIDVENFTYETIEDDVLKVNINFSVEGEEQEVEKRTEDNKVSEEQEALETINETEIENELNFFLDDKIISNIANIEELREKSNAKIIEEERNESISNEEDIQDTREEVEVLEPKEEIFKEGPVFRNVQLSSNEKIKEAVEYIEKNEMKSEEKAAPELIETNEEEIKSKENIIRNEVEANESIIEKENISSISNKRETKDSEEPQNMISEQTTNSEYVTYHIHIVKTEETLDTIIKSYNSNLDVLGLYNDISNIKVGDKLIIPEYLDE